MLLGVQTPSVEHLTPGAIDRGIGREVIDLAAMAKLVLDPWQSYCINEMLKVRDEIYFNPYTERNENLWAAFESGIMVSRQNGKGSILEARELGGLFVLGERLIIHSAHQFDTSKEAFERILFLIEDCPDLEREVTRVSRSHGEEGVEVRVRNPLTGVRGPLQRLRFRTRTKGGGRGFTADCLVLDEAMYLSAQQVGALMPTLSARPNPQLIYTGSAGDKDSVQFGRVRARALKGNDPKLFFAGWEANPCNMFCAPDCDEHDRRDDPRTHAKTNPGLGIRISLEHIEAERRSMDEQTFDQERHGIGEWPVEGEGWKVIGKDRWESREDQLSLLRGQFVLAVDTAPDRSWSCITAVGQNLDGQTHVEITASETEYDYKPGIQWVVNRVNHIWKAQKPAYVVIDPASQAGSLITELEALGIKVITPNTREVAQACGDFVTGIVPRKGEVATIIHLGQTPLTTAVATADTRPLAGLWAWSKQLSSADITPLVAVTIGVWGFKEHVHQAPVATPWMARR